MIWSQFNLLCDVRLELGDDDDEDTRRMNKQQVHSRPISFLKILICMINGISMYRESGVV